MSNEIVKNNAEQPAVENIEIMPPVDIVEESNNFVMHFEVPGCNAASVKVEIENNLLTVECASTLRRNQRPVLFKRIFRLSPVIDFSRIAAETQDGVLTLTLPKASHAKAIRVPVA